MLYQLSIYKKARWETSWEMKAAHTAVASIMLMSNRRCEHRASCYTFLTGTNDVGATHIRPPSTPIIAALLPSHC